MFKRIIGFIGDSNERELRRLQPAVDEINALEPEFEKLSNDELKAKAAGFKARLEEDESLDSLLPEVFAAVREAAKRTIKQRHFDVQLLGGIVLHQGKIAEMKTGEGKTLVATLPVSLNALTGEGVHVVTVNDYLAKRDTQWMGPIYNALGISVASIQHEAAFLFDADYYSGDPDSPHLRAVPRREAYAADVTYGTNNEFGFDYLRDNMVGDLSQCVQRDLNYGIVDEVDNLLIDEARTPLIISGAAEESTKEYYNFARLIPRLRQGEDWVEEARTREVNLTESGVVKMEQWLHLPNLYDPANYGLTHYIDNALKAYVLYKRDRDYAVKDGEVIIVDEFTGRLMFGRRYSEGLHQAIEAKEGVKIQRESITMATITFQNYFRMYDKLAGMTGTAVTEAEEFDKIYKLDVVAIPPNKPLIREEYKDQIYKNEEAKFRAVVREIDEMHKAGRPVLAGATSVENLERLSRLLKEKGIEHEKLSAKDHKREAGKIAQAGRLGAVTIATNMAGRGVDIILGGDPESLARDEISQLTRGRAEASIGKSYEELIRQYDSEEQKLRKYHGPKLEQLVKQRDEADRLSLETEERLLGAEPYSELRGKYIRFTNEEFVLAGESCRDLSKLTSEEIRRCQRALDDYRVLKSDHERNLISAVVAGDAARVLKVVENIREMYEVALSKWERELTWPKARDQQEHMVREWDKVNELRGQYDREMQKLELALVMVNQPELAKMYRDAREASRRAEAEYEKEDHVLSDALEKLKREKAKILEEYTAEEKALEQRFKEDPHQYDAELHLRKEKYKPICAAGREKVIELGGLHIVGTERHEARRIDNQLRGRAGRQGDPGSSRFFVSLEDDIMRRFGGDRVKGFMEWAGFDEDTPLEHGMVSKVIENAQTKVEAYHFDIRKHLVDYDDVVNKQREVIYDERGKILSEADLKANIQEMVKEALRDIVHNNLGDERSDEWDLDGLVAGANAILPLPPSLSKDAISKMSRKEVEQKLEEYAESFYQEREKELEPQNMRIVERLVMLRAFDGRWVEHLTAMENMRQGIGLQSLAQRDPLVAYKTQGHEAFQNLTAGVQHDIVHTIYHVGIVKQEKPREREKAPVAQHLGRNDPCPCGSGKKYKKCCGK